LETPVAMRLAEKPSLYAWVSLRSFEANIRLGNPQKKRETVGRPMTWALLAEEPFACTPLFTSFEGSTGNQNTFQEEICTHKGNENILEA